MSASIVVAAADRLARVPASMTVRVEWVDIDDCVLGNRDRMAPEAVAEKWRLLLQQDGAALFPCIRGEWATIKGVRRFRVVDGRHEFVAALMHGRTEVLVAWLVEREPAAAPVLHGSDRYAAVVKIGVVAVQLGDLVAGAYKASGLSVEAWNDLPAAARDALIEAEIARRLQGVSEIANCLKGAGQ